MVSLVNFLELVVILIFGSESSRERNGQGAKGLGSERSRERLARGQLGHRVNWSGPYWPIRSRN